MHKDTNLRNFIYRTLHSRIVILSLKDLELPLYSTNKIELAFWTQQSQSRLLLTPNNRWHWQWRLRESNDEQRHKPPLCDWFQSTRLTKGHSCRRSINRYRESWFYSFLLIQNNRAGNTIFALFWAIWDAYQIENRHPQVLYGIKRSYLHFRSADI